MKILYVITKANWGGAQRYVFDLATAAQQKGFEAAVAYGQPGTMEEELKKAGIQTHVIHSIQRDVAFSADVKSLFELYRLFAKEKPDIVHLNSSKIGALGGIAARIAGVKKIIYTAHGWAFMEQRPLPARILIWIISWITALAAHTVIAVSNSERTLTRQMPFCAKKAVRIYNGIDLNMHFGSGDMIRNAFPTGVKITGTVGELTKNKNQISLIEQAKNTPDIYVAIVGEGELRKNLEAKIAEYDLADRVKLFGFQKAADVMKGFDTFALPSIKEGLSYVILEARAAGLPVVANRVGGIPEAMDVPLQEFSKERMVEQTFALYN